MDVLDEEEEEPEQAPEETIKQAVRSGPYAMCKKAGLGTYKISRVQG